MGPARAGSFLPCSIIAFMCLTGILEDRAQAQYPPSLVWESRYNHPYSEDHPAKVITDNAGNIYVAGAGEGHLGGSQDFLTVKYDSAGTEVWTARYGFLSFEIDDLCGPWFRLARDVPVGIGLDETGNVYVGGLSTYTLDCNKHGSWRSEYMTAVKYDPDGIQVWVTNLVGEAAAMALNEDGDIFMAGTYYTAGLWGDETPVSYVTAKLDAFGQRHWSVTYDGPTGEYNLATDIALDELGLIHVTGRSMGIGTGYDYATITYGPHGTEFHVNRYNGPAGGHDEAESLFVNAFGEVFVTGSSEGTGTDKDFATVKYNGFGAQVWVARYNGPADGADQAVSIAGGQTDDVFVTGTSEGLASGTDIVTVAYDFLGHQVWEQRYDGPAGGNDSASSVIITTDGDVVVTGQSEGTDSAEDYVTICYESSSGTVLWTARYDGPGSGEDAPASVARDGSGNVIVTGKSRGIETGRDYATVKYDAGGSELWTARYENPGMGGGFEIPAAMAMDPSGNICVTGFTGNLYSVCHGAECDYATVKIDPDGNQLWEARYDGPAGGEDQAHALAVDAAGNIHVTGSSEGVGTAEDYLTIKYDPAGSELWVARHDGSGRAYDVAEAIVLDAGGNIHVTGSSEGAGTAEDYLTIKYDPAGSELWTARYDADAYTDQASDLDVDAFGNVYVTGYSARPGTGYDYATIKYDPDGNELWAARYNGPLDSSDRAFDLALDTAGNVYVTGRSMGIGTDYDYATIKYDTEGNEIWVARYNGPEGSADYGISLVVDALGSVYVTGQSIGAEGFDAATIKYDPDGNELWIARYEAPYQSSVSTSAIKVDASGSAYITGGTYNYDSWHELSSSGYLMLMYDALGNLEWEIHYDGPNIWDEGMDSAVALVLDAGGDFYVTGYSDFQGTRTDFATLKYTHDLSCNDPDGDGYGAPSSLECTYPEWDCDNADPNVNPGNSEDNWEACHNGIDDDCDRLADPSLSDYSFSLYVTCRCRDADGDGYGGPEDQDPALLAGCAYPGRDCEDNDPYVYPNAPELCDDRDNQCPGDPGYGETDPGCPLALVSPENGESLSDPPVFSWHGGQNDLFYLYLVMPIYGYGYSTFVIPTAGLSFAFPEDKWQKQKKIVIPNWWSAWRVLGVDTSANPPTWEVSELRWFKKVM